MLGPCWTAQGMTGLLRGEHTVPSLKLILSVHMKHLEIGLYVEMCVGAITSFEGPLNQTVMCFLAVILSKINLD